MLITRWHRTRPAGRRAVAAPAAAVLLAAALLAAGCAHPDQGRWHPAGAASGAPSAGAAASPATAAQRSPTCSVARVLGTWSLTRLAQQTIVVPVEETAVATVTAQVKAGAGGVILFGSQAPPNLAGSLATLVAAAPGGVPPFVMSDEEGGDVQRMSNVVGDLPSARTLGATRSPAQIQALAQQAGQKLRAAGVTMDLAPVLDLDAGSGPNDHDPIGTRSFSTRPGTASAAGIAFANGLSAAGVVPVVKHFPGLGGASANTDVVPATSRPWSTIQGADLVPFADAVRAGLPAVMISNATIPGLSTVPASVSPAVITGILRQRLGFSGLVLTDSLSAGALSKAGYSIPRASQLAITAGADMVLFTAPASAVPGMVTQIVAAIVAAVDAGTLPRTRLIDAVTHVLAAKHVQLCQ
jgi:beta-N-acetylhexosaminidase